VDTARAVRRRTAVGSTPLVALRNVTELVRGLAGPGKGARIFVKDEAANPSGSFNLETAVGRGSSVRCICHPARHNDEQ